MSAGKSDSWPVDTQFYQLNNVSKKTAHKKKQQQHDSTHIYQQRAPHLAPRWL